MAEAPKPYTYDKSYPFLKEKIINTRKPHHRIQVIGRAFNEIYIPLRLLPGQRVLDVGSCIGDVGNALRFGWVKTVGLDINEDALLAEKEIFSRKKLSVQGNASALPFQNNSFDAVISADLLEHLPDERTAEQTFAEMTRVCKGNKMVHKITVLEDTEWIHADESHRIKWPADQWRSWFAEKGWQTIRSTTKLYPSKYRYFPTIGKMHGYFLLEKTP